MNETVLGELNSQPILTSKNVSDLREYISSKYASSSHNEKADILAHALNKIIDRKIPDFEESHKINLRKNIIKSAVSRNSMDINSDHVFIECIKLKAQEEEFFNELCNWINKTIETEVSSEEIESFVESAYNWAEAMLDSSIEEIIYKLSFNILPLNQDAIDITDTTSGSNSPQNETTVETRIISNIPKKTINNRMKRFQVKTVLIAAAFSIFVVIIGSTPFGSYHKAETETFSEINKEFTSILQQLNAWICDGNRLQKVPGLNVKKVLKMRATAYDLSMESCGKARSDPGYGITFSGTKAKLGRTVAVDPSFIPLGTQLYISFPAPYSKLSGTYIAEDTGRLVVGNTIDIFFGEDKIGQTIIHQKAMDFGVRQVEVYIWDK